MDASPIETSCGCGRLRTGEVKRVAEEKVEWPRGGGGVFEHVQWLGLRWRTKS